MHLLLSCLPSHPHRLGLLSPSYLCGVLPNIKWAQFTSEGSLSSSYFRTLQSKLASVEGNAVLHVRNAAELYISTTYTL